MGEILSQIPSAQRALFQRYHIGGCSSCGYEATDPLSKVCKDHNILDVNEVITFLATSHELDQKIQTEPEVIQGWIQAGEDFSFIDVRSADELLESGAFEPAESMDYSNSEKYMELPKDRRIVFTCLEGDRSLNVASYFIGHKFENVLCVKGGIQAWREKIK